MPSKVNDGSRSKVPTSCEPLLLQIDDTWVHILTDPPDMLSYREIVLLITISADISLKKLHQRYVLNLSFLQSRSESLRCGKNMSQI